MSLPILFYHQVFGFIVMHLMKSPSFHPELCNFIGWALHCTTPWSWVIPKITNPRPPVLRAHSFENAPTLGHYPTLSGDFLMKSGLNSPDFKDFNYLFWIGSQEYRRNQTIIYLYIWFLSQIQLNFLLNEWHCFGYITKLEKQKHNLDFLTYGLLSMGL